MAYTVGKPMKKNFYSAGSGVGEIAMPPAGEIPPVLQDSPELFSAAQEPEQEQVHQQVAQEEAPEVESHDEDNDSETVVEAPKFKTKQAEENFRNLREARERAEWERDMLKAQMAEMQRSMQQPYKQPEAPKYQEPESDDFNFDVADDALLEGKDAKRLINEIKKVKQQLKQYGSKSQETAVEAKIRATYPDFEKVVSADNVAILNQQFPEIAQTLRDTPDLYNKASAAYAIMKRFGIYKDMSYEEDKMKAIKNAQKPRPINSVSPQQGDSPLSKANAFANGMTKELQKQLLKEMQDARKRL